MSWGVDAPITSATKESSNLHGSVLRRWVRTSDMSSRSIKNRRNAQSGAMICAVLASIDSTSPRATASSYRQKRARSFSKLEDPQR